MRYLALPVLGVEAAGVIEAVGEGVDDPRSATASSTGISLGAYSQLRLAPAWRVVKIPDQVSDEAAAATYSKGATANYLLHQIYPVKRSHTVLVHAAAGGVGKLLCQWAEHLGATVIGTVGSQEKVEIARTAGCAHVIVYRDQDFLAEVKKITDGVGVHVVYDCVGLHTFEKSLDTLRPLGMMVNFGQASGPVPPFDISVLAQKGSIFLAKPTLATFVKTRESIQALANGVFQALQSEAINVEIGRTAKLAEAADVHSALEARRTTGSTVLLP